MKKRLTLVVAFLFVLSVFSVCTAAAASEELSASSHGCNFVRRDGAIFLEYTEEYVPSLPGYGSVSFRSAEEMVLTFESGTLKGSELYDIREMCGGKAEIKLLPEVVYEPVFSGAESVWEVAWEGEDRYTYNFSGDSDGRITVFSETDC